jgi:hypothetical protein
MWEIFLGGMCDGFGGSSNDVMGTVRIADPGQVTLLWMLEYNTMPQVKQ